MKHPLQTIYLDDEGVVRFRKNAIVRFLLDEGPFDLGQLAHRRFDKEEWAQFMMLIGYSVSGYGDTDVPKEYVDEADAQADKLSETSNMKILEVHETPANEHSAYYRVGCALGPGAKTVSKIHRTHDIDGGPDRVRIHFTENYSWIDYPLSAVAVHEVDGDPH